MVSAIATLVVRRNKGIRSVKETGSIYGIPGLARRVTKFNPLRSPLLTSDLNFIMMTSCINCVIYCPPINSYRGILKIDTNTDTAT